jgi:hypothetical protein
MVQLVLKDLWDFKALKVSQVLMVLLVHRDLKVLSVSSALLVLKGL